MRVFNRYTTMNCLLPSKQKTYFPISIFFVENQKSPGIILVKNDLRRRKIEHMPFERFANVRIGEYGFVLRIGEDDLYEIEEQERKMLSVIEPRCCHLSTQKHNHTYNPSHYLVRLMHVLVQSAKCH